MCKKIWAVTRLNLKNIRTPYFVTGLVVLVMFAQTAIKMIISVNQGGALEEIPLGVSAFFWLLPLMAAIYIPSKNFRGISNLGGRRNDFFGGGLAAHAIITFFVSLASTLTYFAFDLTSEKYFMGVFHPVEIFGWIERGAFISFIRQFAFLFLAAAVIHTLTAVQDKWYGWAADAVIAAVIAVFVPIAPLRKALVWFFELIIFNSNAPLQISVCMVLALAVYALNKPIFARNAI